MNNETLTQTCDTHATLRRNPKSRKGRDRYADAGKAGRDFADEVLGAETGRHGDGIEPSDVRVAFALVAHLTSWSRCGDYLEVTQLAAAAGVDPGTCRRSLHRLARLTSLVYEPGGRGRRVSWLGFGTPAEVIHKEATGEAEPDEKNAPRGAYSTKRTRHCGAIVSTEKVINEEEGASPVERPGRTAAELAALHDEPERTDPVPLDPVAGQTGNPEPGNDAHTLQPVPLESPPPSDFRATMEPADNLAAMLDPVAGVDQLREARELADELNARPSAAGWERHAAVMAQEGHRYRWKSQLRAALEERTGTGASTVADFYRAKAAQRACATCHGSTWTETDEGQLAKCPNCQTGTGTSSTWTSQASPGAAPTPEPQPSPTSSAPPLTPPASPQPAGPSPQPASLTPTPDPAEHLAAARKALAGARA